MKNTFIVLVVLLLVVPGCKKDDPPPPIDLGHAYFPTDTGRWIDYAVDTVWRNDLTGVTDSTSYALREKIVNDFTDRKGARHSA